MSGSLIEVRKCGWASRAQLRTRSSELSETVTSRPLEIVGRTLDIGEKGRAQSGKETDVAGRGDLRRRS
jgi:hypothetical protein